MKALGLHSEVVMALEDESYDMLDRVDDRDDVCLQIESPVLEQVFRRVCQPVYDTVVLEVKNERA